MKLQPKPKLVEHLSEIDAPHVERSQRQKLIDSADGKGAIHIELAQPVDYCNAGHQEQAAAGRLV